MNKKPDIRREAILNFIAKAKLSTTGYKDNSPDKDRSYNVIPSNKITMEGVSQPILGTDNLGNKIVMQPNENYQFPGNYVIEQPINNLNNNNMKYGGGNNMNYSVDTNDVSMYYTYNPTQFMEEGGEAEDGSHKEVLMRSVIQALKQGYHPQKISQSLMSKGYAMNERHANDIINAAGYASKIQGFSRQEGGQAEQPQGGGQEEQMQQIAQQVAQALQQGAKPEELLQQLIEAGLPEEQAQAMIQQIMQEMQGQRQEQEMPEEQMEQQQVPQQRRGGSFFARY